MDKGLPALGIHAYNGGLFAPDPALDALIVSEASLDSFSALSDHDFETDLNVNILGHIFEQSITDLEQIRAEIRGGVADQQQSRRKRDGIFYTPDLITRFMVARAIGGWLAARYAGIEARYRTGKPGPLSNETRLKIWLNYLEVLQHIKVLDLACGSGAFLVAAFDYLLAEYERVNRAIGELTGAPGQLGLFDLDRQILQGNLFGVDLNPESVEITKLSLWLKTARRDRPLSNLDANIRRGNSLVAPPGPNTSSALVAAFDKLPADTHPFDWCAAFPEVFAVGGFDVVIGNPPYVRQEALGPFKPYLAQRYASYHGVADLYVYFYERGLELLAPDGKLSYIVTNKWLRAGYGEPLRRLFSERAVLEEIIDFGHAPIFEDADTFPCILLLGPRSGQVGAGASASREAGVLGATAASPGPAPPVGTASPSAGMATAAGERDEPPMVSVCPVPRDRAPELSLEHYVHEHAYPVPWSRYDASPWSLESPEVEALMGRLRERGVPLGQFAGCKPMYGIKTGLNEAFLIDDATRVALVRDDPACADIIKPYLRGQDIGRWTPDWQGLWMIVLASSGNHAWPWSGGGEEAEALFARSYPSLNRHMQPLRERLMARQDKGRYWWELRSCDYYAAFEQPKIVYQVIQFHPQYALDQNRLIWERQDLLPADRRPLPPRGPQLPADVVAQLALPATHEGRGPEPRRLSHGDPAHRRAHLGHPRRDRGAGRRAPRPDHRIPSADPRVAEMASFGNFARKTGPATGGLCPPEWRGLRRRGSQAPPQGRPAPEPRHYHRTDRHPRPLCPAPATPGGRDPRPGAPPVRLGESGLPVER